MASVLLAAEVFVGFAAQNWDMGACLCVAPEHAKCLALVMSTLQGHMSHCAELEFFAAQAALSPPHILSHLATED